MMKQDETIAKHRNELNGPVRIEHVPSFTLAGISGITTNAAELSGNGIIGSLYAQFHTVDIGARLKVHQQQSGLYGCYYNYERGDAGQYEIMVGVRIEDEVPNHFPPPITTFTVPAATYAVFVTERGPIYEKVQQAWSHIWEWSQKPGNERAFTGDYEYYNQLTDPNDGEVEIYIAIR